MRQALTIVGIGAAIGLACVFVAAKLVSAILYRVIPADPAGLLAGVAAVALVRVVRRWQTRLPASRRVSAPFDDWRSDPWI